jgi:hypothetical protein
MTIPTFEERFNYLRLDGKVGRETFGFDRWINQQFYHLDRDWKKVRRQVIIRDNGCDLGCEDRPIPNGVRIIIHHINPITMEDVKNRNSILFDLDNLITTMDSTHNAIHYGDESLLLMSKPIVRHPNDTCPWR